MKGQLAVQEKKKVTVLPAGTFWQQAAVRPVGDHVTLPEQGTALTASSFGQDFSQVAVDSEPSRGRFDRAPRCPLVPTRCPFGGACQICPAGVRAGSTRNQPSNESEREAGRAVDIVMRWLQPRQQEESECCEPSCSQIVQRKATDTRTIGHIPPVVDRVLRSPGQPLNGEVRAFMEHRFGHDFSDVRVHSDARAAESARSVGALAYTVGHDVVFGAGLYAPMTDAGNRLLAHELTHVVQQRRGGICPELDPPSAHERSANESASTIAAGKPLDDIFGATAIGLARQPVQSGGPQLLPALSPAELLEFMLTQRGWGTSTSGPPAFDPKGIGKPTGKGYQTYAAVQVLDGQGRQVKVGLGAYLGKGTGHAEQEAISALEQAMPKDVDLRGGKMMVAVDQKPCPGCDSAIRSAATKMGLAEYEVYGPMRESLCAPGEQVTAKTAATTAFQLGRRPEPVLIKGESLTQTTAVPQRVQPASTTAPQPEGAGGTKLTEKPGDATKITPEPKTPPSTSKVPSEAALQVRATQPGTPSRTTPKREVPATAGKVPLEIGGVLKTGLGSRVAGFAKAVGVNIAFVGIELLLSALKAKYERERIQQDLDAKADYVQLTLDSKSDELARLRRQNPGAPLYANVTVVLTFGESTKLYPMGVVASDMFYEHLDILAVNISTQKQAHGMEHWYDRRDILWFGRYAEIYYRLVCSIELPPR